jgi:hypothetical protein
MLDVTTPGCEKLRPIRKTFEFQRVTRRIQKEHRRLLAYRTLEANFRSDQKLES